MLYEQCFARLPRVRALDLLEDWRPAYGEWLGEQVGAGFDHTTTARALEAADIAWEEAKAGENDAAWMLRRAAAGMGDGMGEALNAALDFANAKGAGAPHAHAMTEADWKASPWYRKEIPFRPDMTETRARIMAENFDHRRYRDALIARGAEVYNGVGDMALGFGAMLLGGVPDPVNLLSLGGGMAAASRAATLGGALRAGARAGAAEGALFTAVADAIVLPDLATRGEDAEFADFALDTIAGALLGGVFGAAGGALARHRALQQNGSALPDTPDSLDVIDTPDAPEAVRAAETPGAAAFDASPDGGLMERATAPAPFDTSPDSFLGRAGQGPHTQPGETISLGEPSRAFDASPDGDFLLRAGEGPHTQPGETIYLGEPLPDLPGPAPLPEGMHWKQRVELAYTPETPTGAEQRRTAFARDQHGQAATAARQARIERARAEAPARNAALEAALRRAQEEAAARNAENDMLRAGMSARDRDDAARALALSVMDFNNAAPVDVSPVLGESILLEQVRREALSTVVVRSDELGVREGASLKEYQQAAREIYRVLQNKSVVHEELGEIRFTGAGFGEMKKTGFDLRKWQLVPQLHNIVKSARYIRKSELTKKRKDRIKAFHWLEASVELDGKHLRVGVNIAEDIDGNKFYNLNEDVDAWEVKYKKASDDRSGLIPPGGSEALQKEAVASPVDSSVAKDAGGVNMRVERDIHFSNAKSSSILPLTRNR